MPPQFKKFKEKDLKIQVKKLLEAGRVGLATDIDGTISPIAPSPSEAAVSLEGREALARLNASLVFTVVAVATGRTCLEARNLVKVPDLVYIGSHGLEWLLPGETAPTFAPAALLFKPAISLVLAQFKAVLNSTGPVKDRYQKNSNLSNILVEDKGVTGSIHYRRCPDPAGARDFILGQLEKIAPGSGLRLSEGRMVVELRPPVKFNKGTALLELVEIFNLRSLIFLGDDLTDLEAFRALGQYQAAKTPAKIPFQKVAIGVYSPEMPPAMAEKADFLVSGVEGIKQFLGWLASQV